jgi:hypothetical protein
MLTFDEVIAIKLDFQREHLKPAAAYVKGILIARLGTTVKGTPAEKADEWCIKVFLKMELPANIKLPKKYKQVEIVVETT